MCAVLQEYGCCHSSNVGVSSPQVDLPLVLLLPPFAFPWRTPFVPAPLCSPCRQLIILLHHSLLPGFAAALLMPRFAVLFADEVAVGMSRVMAVDADAAEALVL